MISSLDPKLKDIYEQALELAEQAKAASSDPVEIARYINDKIADRVTYYINDYSDDDDNAAGVFLDGLANCDGYSDAFYLAGSLAGLEVQYQHGAAIDAGSDDTHMWNLMKVNDSWYAVDVTWSDQDDELNSISYKWFLAGEDRMDRTHMWNRATSIEIAETTDMDLRPRQEYMVRSVQDFEQIASEISENRYPTAEIFFETDNAAECHEELFRVLHQCGIGNITYGWREDMQCLFLKYLEY